MPSPEAAPDASSANSSGRSTANLRAVQPGETVQDAQANQRVESELAAMKAGPIADKEVAEEAAYAEKAARESATESVLGKISEDKLYRKSGEMRDTKQVRAAREKISKIGNKAGEQQAEEFIKGRAEVEKGYVRNRDQALEMASAEKPERDMAANLKAIGSEDLAKGRVEQAKAHGEAAGATYKAAAESALTEIGKLTRGETDSPQLLSGNKLAAWETVKQAVAGKDALPAFEIDKGRGKNKVHESVYASPSSPNVVMVERRNGRTGEIISVHTVRTQGEALRDRKDVQIPSKELRTLMNAARKHDADNTGTKAVLNSQSARIEKGRNGYGSVGEYAYLQNRKIGLDSPSAPAELDGYHKRHKQQQRALPWWSRFFGGAGF